MSLALAIEARAGAKDPDSLLGSLIFLEAGGAEKRLARLMGSRSVSNLIERAREGTAGRVPAFTGEEHRVEVIDFPDGLLPSRWKRDLVTMLLRPDGATTEEIETYFAGGGSYSSAKAIDQLRTDLKAFSVKVDSQRFEGRLDYRFKISGTSAWRMQKIIANGWSV